MDERALIARIFAPLVSSPGAAALQDDVAALETGGGVLVANCDALVEGVHTLDGDPLDTVARKLVRVNVSDLLAKGARPREALLTLAWPMDRETDGLEAFAQALGEELDTWGARLVGGDTVATEGPYVLSLTLTGVCDVAGPVRRNGARAGDAVWLTGTIGAGVLGLEAARAGRTGWPASAYRVPDIPPLAVADLVAARATASLDVSDGLLIDAERLAHASGVRLEIDLDAVPWAGPAEDLDALMRQATGGDDYQILLTAPPDVALDVLSPDGVRLTRIGRVDAGSGLSLRQDSAPVLVPQQSGHEHMFPSKREPST